MIAIFTTHRLAPGMTIEFERERCLVVRVSESAAVVAVPQAARSFTTLGGRHVQFVPPPKLVRISPNSECRILCRGPVDARHDLYDGFHQSSQ